MQIDIVKFKNMNSSVVLITNSENKSFGTGFIVHVNKNYCYILTCLHVVDSMPNSLLIDYTTEAKIIAEGSSRGIDLAILEAKIENQKPLELMNSSCIDFKVIGYKPYHKDTHVCEPIDCLFDEEVDMITPNGRIKGLKVNIAREDTIVSGYSGSPLICKKSGKVIAVVSDKHGNKDGYAISIKHLKDIWEEMPLELQWDKEHRLILTSKTNEFQIFVSYMYSNIEEERWLLKLLKSIKKILTWRLKKDDDFFEILYKKEINIKKEINSSDIHLILLSNRYINSQKDINELEKISQKSNNMMILEYDKFLMPSIIKNKKTFRFWYQNREGSIFTYSSTSQESVNFNKYGYFDLTEDIATTIQKSIEKVHIKKEYSHKVFLAKTTDDLEYYRSDIARYLEDLNYDVYPKKIYPQDRGFEFKEAVESDLRGCELFIQLLSQYSKEAPPDLKEGYSKAQFDIAKGFKIPILQWSKQIDLKSVKNEIKKELLSTEYIRIVPIEEFKRMIEEHFREIKNRLEKQKKIEDIIFINFCYQKSYDREVAEKIYNSLSDKQQLVNRIPKRMKPSELSEYIDDSLLMCDYYILVYGHTNLVWINKQLMIRFYKIKNKREKEISSVIIYDTPPQEKEKIPFKASYIEIIDGREVESIDKIQNFISKRRNS
jgi:hypothetical protein